MKGRGLKRLYRWMPIVAALPMLQFSLCANVLNPVGGQVANALPAIVFNAVFSAALQALLGLLGIGAGNVFGDTGTGGGGFGF